MPKKKLVPIIAQIGIRVPVNAQKISYKTSRKVRKSQGVPVISQIFLALVPVIAQQKCVGVRISAQIWGGYIINVQKNLGFQFFF